MMKNQIEQANLLKNLHIKGAPLILFNIWDAGSAKEALEMGVKAIGTSSWSAARAHGYDDGEKLPLGLVLANVERIIRVVSVPVTVDIESGYGQTAEEVKETVMKIVKAGAVGINLEDQIIGENALYSLNDQCLRIKAARESTSIPFFINARTDIFLKSPPQNHSHTHLKEALSRTHAYAKSGADGFFVPGLENEEFIQKLCELSPIPINVMISENSPSFKTLVDLGVSRISYGPYPYTMALKSLRNEAYQILSKDTSNV
jgi:2-methylisocitrate lyase-like PEP mutase family enzyme